MKLLVLLSRFPHPLDKGDKLRAFHQLRCLAARHEICLFALSDEDVTPEADAAVRPLCRGGLVVHRLRRPGIARNLSWALATGRPLQVGYFYDAQAQRRFDKVLVRFQPAHIYCQLIRTAEYVRPHAGRWRMTLDYMDVFSAGMARRATQAPAWQRPVLALEARRLRAWYRGALPVAALGAQAARTVADVYDTRRVIARFEDLYAQLLEPAPAGTPAHSPPA